MSEMAENARKKMVDGMASTLLGINEKELYEKSLAAAETIRELSLQERVVVCGGAGANKTTFAEALSRALSAPSFDLDEFIPGGFTPDRREYEKRFSKGMDALWADMPSVGSWIVDHVEACGPAVIQLLGPSVAIHLNPGVEHLKSVAQARDLVGEGSGGLRLKRALETAIRAKSQFQALRGKVVYRGNGIEIKDLSGEG